MHEQGGIEMTKRYLLLVALLAVLLTAGFSRVEAQKRNILIYACMDVSSGKAYLISSNQSCKTDEIRVVWKGPIPHRSEAGKDGLPVLENPIAPDTLRDKTCEGCDYLDRKYADAAPSGVYSSGV
jgi:hypothetical protein